MTAVRLQTVRAYASEEDCGERLSDWLRASAYHGYAYAYPHKTAYRPFVEPIALRDAWAREPRGSVALYVHVPYCEFRCGFCNLFATHRADAEEASGFLDALARQARIVRDELGPMRVSTIVVGGGTPTWLAPNEIERLFAVCVSFGSSLSDVPSSVETSPATASKDRLGLLHDAGVERVSLGVQSFLERTRRALGRPDRANAARDALARIASAGFPRLNVDLVYGATGQTERDHLEDIETALTYAPTEFFLYPLYVRPETGLSRRTAGFEDTRPALYRVARERLLDAGYEQVSMRNFHRRTSGRLQNGYRCQHDATIGLGPGARSYTKDLHYSDEWAVGGPHVAALVDAYVGRPEAAFAHARHGFLLDESERQRRYVLQSLLQAEGIDVHEHIRLFGQSPLQAMPRLTQLVDSGFAEAHPDRLRLTPTGLGLSDAIGPWLYSRRVRSAMREYELR